MFVFYAHFNSLFPRSLNVEFPYSVACYFLVSITCYIFFYFLLIRRYMYHRILRRGGVGKEGKLKKNGVCMKTYSFFFKLYLNCVIDEKSKKRIGQVITIVGT